MLEYTLLFLSLLNTAMFWRLKHIIKTKREYLEKLEHDRLNFLEDRENEHRQKMEDIHEQQEHLQFLLEAIEWRSTQILNEELRRSDEMKRKGFIDRDNKLKEKKEAKSKSIENRINRASKLRDKVRSSSKRLHL